MFDYFAAISQLPYKKQIKALDLLDDLAYEYNKHGYDQAAIDKIEKQLESLLAKHNLV